MYYRNGINSICHYFYALFNLFGVFSLSIALFLKLFSLLVLRVSHLLFSFFVSLATVRKHLCQFSYFPDPFVVWISRALCFGFFFSKSTNLFRILSSNLQILFLLTKTYQAQIPLVTRNSTLFILYPP